VNPSSRQSKYVALLRGVNNAGKGTRVAMSELRSLFESLGFLNVRTVLNSGNVVFSAPNSRPEDVLARIEKALSAKLGINCPVILLSAEEVAAAVRDNPLYRIATNPSSFLVLVLRSPSDQARLKPLLKQRWSPEVLALGSRVAYLWCAKGVAKSPLWAAVERALERTGTARNITTMTKLIALIEDSSGPKSKC